MERAGRPRSVDGVATSKFAVPRRRDDVVRRARLNSFIDAAVGGKGTLIAAPAGYGKTTLAVDWLDTSDFAAVWVSLDAWDAELPVFTRAVAAAIRLRFDIDVALGDERFWQPRTVATVLINAIAEQDDYVVLVLDDVHSVESSEEIMATLGYVLERAPENLHVVMTSRTRPAVPSLSRLIARREVATIGAVDLAFTAREVKELLASIGRPISDDESEALYERTEGWAAALILGAGTDDSPGGRDQHGTPGVGLSLSDYVHGEALDNVPEDLRKFLRRISLLPIWTPALCNGVSGRRDAERLLKDAASSVLFISQHADEPPMYRCHPLLRSLLMQQFRTDDAVGFADAGREAADTLARFGMLNEAVELLFDLEEWSNAASVLVEIAPRLVQQGQARGLAEWIDRLPRKALAEKSELLVWRAHAAYKLQDPDEALRLIDDAVRALRDVGDMRGLVPALFVRGETQRLKGYYDEALTTFGEARALLENSGDEDLRLTGQALRHIGVTHAIMGDLDAAVVELEEARRLYEQVGDLDGISNACHTLAQCYSRRGETAAALGALQRGRSALERAGNTFDLGLNLNNTGMLYYEIGEYEQALNVYERGLRVVRGAGDTRSEAFMMAGSAETYRDMGRFDESLAMYDAARPVIEGLQIPELFAEFTEGLALTRVGLNQVEEAAQLAGTVAPKASDGPSRLARHAIVDARIAIARGDAASATKLADHALRSFEAAGDKHGMAIAGFVRARALFDGHQPRKAMAALGDVAQTCESLGFAKFLRPLAATSSDMIEYARVRHIADAMLADLRQQDAPTGEEPSPVAPAAAEGVLPVVRGFAFGRGGVMVGDRQVSDLEWRSEKSKEMLFLLLLNREPFSKADIFSALWPDLSESKCNSNFHSSLYRLRRAIFHECVVRAADGTYELNPKGTFITDVEAFSGAMLAADVARDEDARAERLEQAVAQYKGPLLVATYGEWVEPLRREMEDRYIEALNELAAYRLRRGEFEDALALFRLLEAVDPYSEAAAFGVMRSHMGLNDRPAATRYFRRFRQLLKDELDEEPSPRLAELYREASAAG